MLRARLCNKRLAAPKQGPEAGPWGIPGPIRLSLPHLNARECHAQHRRSAETRDRPPVATRNSQRGPGDPQGVGAVSTSHCSVAQAGRGAAAPGRDALAPRAEGAARLAVGRANEVSVRRQGATLAARATRTVRRGICEARRRQRAIDLQLGAWTRDAEASAGCRHRAAAQHGQARSPRATRQHQAEARDAVASTLTHGSVHKKPRRTSPRFSWELRRDYLYALF